MSILIKKNIEELINKKTILVTNNFNKIQIQPAG